VQVVQIVTNTGYDDIALHNTKTWFAIPLDDKGMVVGSYYYKQGNTDMAAQVDGAEGSEHALKIEDGATERNGATYPGKPYYLPAVTTNSSWNKDKNVGSIVVADKPDAQNLMRTCVFTSMIVAVNYMDTGKDVVLGTFRWGWKDSGQTPIHTGTVSLKGNTPNETELNTIKHFFKDYKFFK
jgi:hypothetical protein